MQKIPTRSKGPLSQDESLQQSPNSQNTPFLADTSLSSKNKESKHSFVVRISEKERLLINKLSNYSGETIVTIFTKSLRLYRAIAEAADEGGSLVMVTEENGYFLGREGFNHSRLSSREMKVRTLDYSPKTTDKGLAVAIPPPGRDTPNGNDILNGNDTFIGQVEPSPIGRKHSLSDKVEISEAIIAVRDQFANNNLTPITLNPLYITALKGSKSKKITLTADASFSERLQMLEKKTGLTKSLIVRNSVQLYDFVKRKFQEPGVKFFIGGKPILAI
jgi:hypothetical protein